MKKYTLLYIAAAVGLATAVTGCRDEHLIGEGEGTMMLETAIVSDVTVVSRALTPDQQNEMCNSALIWISDPSKGLLYKFNGIGNFPAEGLPMTSGHYAAEAWLGDSIPASWEAKHYYGREDFEITRGGVTNVELTCPIRNTLVSLTLGEAVANALTDITFTVGLKDGVTDGSHSLTFEPTLNASGALVCDKKGYYMINSRTKGLTWTLEGTDANGNAVKKEGEYTDPAVTEAPCLAHATEYIFKIEYNPAGEIEIGGAYFSIEVDPTPVNTENKEVVIAMPPEIKGSGIDLNQPIAGEPGSNDRVAVNITASSSLTEVLLTGSLLEGANLAPDYELIGMDQSHLTALSAAGITIQTFKQIAGSDAITNMRIIIEEALLNSLAVGDYALNIEAKDEAGMTGKQTVNFSISDAPIVLAPIEASSLTYTSATLKATVKEGVDQSHIGFEVRRVADARSYDDWTFVSGTVDGTALTAVIDDFVPGATYEYRGIVNDYATKEQTFTTVDYQLPNAGFEEWQTSSTPYLIYGAGSEMFWDSGNHGSATMSKNVTVPDTSVKHSGSQSAKLASQFVGIFGIGKFAAGNIFAGSYLHTDGTDGVLGWGRPWEFAPKALKGYVKYSPVAIDRISSNAPAEYVKGDMDRGIIYVALLTDEKVTCGYEGCTDQWPVVIKTKSTQLFDKNAANVLAYGEMVFDKTAGDGMVEFNIPIEKLRDGKVANIVIVASASKGGDYFTGGDGSTMWIDDFKLVY